MVYDYFETGLIGVLTLVSDEEGLRQIHFQKDGAPVRVESDWKRDPAFFNPVKAQLRAYFHGALKYFDLPLAPMGTPFQKSVWQTLQKIPYGTVASYRWVAEQIGNPKAVRAVGGAAPLPCMLRLEDHVAALPVEGDGDEADAVGDEGDVGVLGDADDADDGHAVTPQALAQAARRHVARRGRWGRGGRRGRWGPRRRR